MKHRILFSLLVLTVLIVPACTPTDTPGDATVVAQSPAPRVSPVVPFGAPETRDLQPTVEVVSNCGGVTQPVVKHPSITVGSSHSVEWEIGGSVGVGLQIGSDLTPAKVDLTAALEGSVARDLTNSMEQSNAWDLPADPGYIMEYTIMWREIWQPGYIDATFLDPEPEVLRINVSYRTGVQSEIVGQNAALCNADSGLEVPATRVIATTQSSSSSGSQRSSCIATEQGPLAQTDHFFAGPVHVVQLWRQNGQSPWGTGEVMAVVVGDVSIVAAGGNVWTYPSSTCESIARVHMQDSVNTRTSMGVDSRSVTEEELRNAGLIR